MIKGKELFTKNAVVYTLALICCLLWGSAIPFIKIGYDIFGVTSADTASQILFGGLRFTLAGAATVLIFSVTQKHFIFPKKRSWLDILKLGIVQTTLQYLFFYIGVSHASAAKSSIINGVSPFFSILIVCFIYRQEKLTKSKLIGSLLGFAGIIIINFDFTTLQTSMTFLGEGFILISSIAASLSSIMTKNYSRYENPVVLSGYQFLIGGALMCAIGIFMGGRLNLSCAAGIGVIAYLVLLSAISYALWSLLLKYNPVSRVTIFAFMIPVFGVIISALMLNETKQAFNIQTIVSLALVCAGIIFINKAKAQN
jgi:drug/metabolite transporter (DMT)-like permease